MPYVRRTNEIAATPAEAGRIGARQRWGAPRRLNLGQLPDADRQAIYDNVSAYINARRGRPGREAD